MKTRISIVDDEESVLDTLGSSLELSGEIICLGRHSSAAEALHFIPKHRPDIVLMDIVLPGMSGIDCTQRLKALMPDLAIIMFTGSADRLLLFQSLMAGASGYLVKPSSAQECIGAINEVVAGGAPLSRAIARMLVSSFRGRNYGGEGVDVLSPREREIMACLFQGCTDKQMAQTLGIGLATVHTHLHRIFGKLGVSNRQEATSKYLGSSTEC